MRRVLVALVVVVALLASHVAAQCGSCPTTSVATDAATACSYDFNTLITNLAQENEGCTLGVYTDTTGHATIGYGFNLVQSGADSILSQAGITNVSVNDLINGACLTPSQATAILSVELGQAISCAQGLANNWSSLPVTAQAVMTDMSFNLGCGGFSSFTNTLSNINSGNWSGAVSGMMNSLWCSQVGNRCTRDSALMADSAYCGGGGGNSGGGSSGGGSGSGSSGSGAQCDPNCATFSSSTGCGCSACSAGYYVDQDGVTCDQCTTDPNCAQVGQLCSGNGDTENQCSSCASGYTLDSDGVDCDSGSDSTGSGSGNCDPNCATFTGATGCGCSACAAGYYVDQDGVTCDQCTTDPNCTQVGQLCSGNGDTENQCSACADGYTVDQDGVDCDSESYEQVPGAGNNKTSNRSRTLTIVLSTVFSVVGAAAIAIIVVLIVRHRRRRAQLPTAMELPTHDSGVVYARMAQA